jgi:hypothetical protein
VPEWRRRVPELALAELPRRQQHRDTAAAAVTAADEAVEDAAQGRYCELVVGDALTLARYRTWTLGQHAPTETCRRDLAEPQIEMERAAADVRRRLGDLYQQ